MTPKRARPSTRSVRSRATLPAALASPPPCAGGSCRSSCTCWWGIGLSPDSRSVRPWCTPSQLLRRRPSRLLRCGVRRRADLLRRIDNDGRRACTLLARSRTTARRVGAARRGGARSRAAKHRQARVWISDSVGSGWSPHVPTGAPAAGRPPRRGRAPQFLVVHLGALVLNAGSSSVKYELYDVNKVTREATELCAGLTERIGEPAEATIRHRAADGTSVKAQVDMADHAAARCADRGPADGGGRADREGVGHRGGRAPGGARRHVDDRAGDHRLDGGGGDREGDPDGAAAQPRPPPGDPRRPRGLLGGAARRGLRHGVPRDDARLGAHVRAAEGAHRRARRPSVRLPRHELHLPAPEGGRAPGARRRLPQPDHVPPGERRVDGGRRERAVRRHDDGAHAARGARDGDACGRRRRGRPRLPRLPPQDVRQGD